MGRFSQNGSHMWKIEYQNRGAPHYHVLLWIQDAPVIDVDDPEKVLAWIEDRITCKLPDKDCNPELHALETILLGSSTFNDIHNIIVVP